MSKFDAIRGWREFWALWMLPLCVGWCWEQPSKISLLNSINLWLGVICGQMMQRNFLTYADSVHDCIIPHREIDCQQRGIGCGVFLQGTAVQKWAWRKQSHVCQSRNIPKSGESKPQCSVSRTQNSTPFYLRSGSDCRESACNVGDLGLIPGSERSPGEGNGNPLQYSCLENPMHRGVW